MNAEQRAKFEAWAKSQKYNLSKKFGLHEYNTTRIANAAWQACLAANAIDQPPADEPCRCGFKRLAADKLAAVLDDWVYRDIIDPRSAAADARLSYGEPFSREEVNRILGRPLDAPFERSIAVPADDERERLPLTDDELSALIEACNHADRHGQCRPPWNRAGMDAKRKLVNEERRRAALGTREEPS